MSDENPDQAQEFEEAGATNDELLIAAARKDHTELLDEVLGQPGTFDINFADGIGNTALHYAAQYSCYDSVSRLLKVSGIRLDAKNGQWETPLHLAAAADDLDMVKLLIEAGANPNVLNKLKQKPGSMATDAEVKRVLQSAVLATQLRSSDIAQDDDDDEEGEEEGEEDE